LRMEVKPPLVSRLEAMHQMVLNCLSLINQSSDAPAALVNAGMEDNIVSFNQNGTELKELIEQQIKLKHSPKKEAAALALELQRKNDIIQKLSQQASVWNQQLKELKQTQLDVLVNPTTAQLEESDAENQDENVDQMQENDD